MFTRVAKDNPQHAKITEALASVASNSTDYNALARAHNENAIGEYVRFPYKEGKLAIVASQLAQRGLQRDLDFTIQGLEVAKADGEGTEYTVFVHRLTDKPANIIQPQRGRRGPKADAGEASGDAGAEAGKTDAGKTADAKPAKGKGK